MSVIEIAGRKLGSAIRQSLSLKLVLIMAAVCDSH